MSASVGYPQQGFVGRFLKRPHVKGLAYDLSQLLPNVAAAEHVSQEQIDNLFEANCIKQKRQNVSDAATIAMKIVASKATVEDLRGRKWKHLLDLADRFDADKNSIQTSLDDAAERHFRHIYEQLIVKGDVTPELRDWLIEEGEQLGLTEQRLKSGIASVAQPLLDKKLNDILQDCMMSPDEEASLNSLAASIGITLDINDDETLRALDISRMRWSISQGHLPIVDCPLMLKKGEICHAVVTATAFEERTRTTRVGYAGPSARIKIVKGVYYNVGSYRALRTTEAYSHCLGTGHFVVTNKRVLFSSSQKNSAFAIDSIIDWTLYSDGIELRRATGKPTTYVFGQGNGLFLEILVAARGKFVG